MSKLLPWVLSRSKREWRLHPEGTDRRKRPLAMVCKRKTDGSWIGVIQATDGYSGCISGPYPCVEDAVRWVEDVISNTKQLSCLFS